LRRAHRVSVEPPRGRPNAREAAVGTRCSAQSLPFETLTVDKCRGQLYHSAASSQARGLPEQYQRTPGGVCTPGCALHGAHARDELQDGPPRPLNGSVARCVGWIVASAAGLLHPWKDARARNDDQLCAPQVAGRRSPFAQGLRSGESRDPWPEPRATPSCLSGKRTRW